jgi:hypothetical protein
MTADARLIEGANGKWRLVCMGRFRSLGQSDPATYKAFVTFFQDGAQTSLIPGQVSTAMPWFDQTLLSDRLTMTHPMVDPAGSLTVRMTRANVDPRRLHSCQVVIKQNGAEVMRAESRPPRPVSKPAGTFVHAGGPANSDNMNAVALGDLDDDGDLDVFQGNGSAYPNRVWRNDGSGGFTDSGQLIGNHYTRALALGDVDNDGDLDVLEGNWMQYNRIWRNDGTGTFPGPGEVVDTCASFPCVINQSTTSVALGDLNGDDYLDVVEGNKDQPNRIFLNNGSGTFTDTGQALGNHSTHSVALGDLDRDGDLDLFEANAFGQANRIWWNDGTGRFTLSAQSVGSSCTSARIADLDGDGDLDVFLGRYTQGSRVLINNNGAGAFSDTGQSLGSYNNTLDVELGDVDGDGDLDAFQANYINPKRIWLNDGTGNFTDSGQALALDGTQDIALGDLDGDGDLDAFEGNKATPHRVWRNQ